MPKMKTRKSAVKRLTQTGTGKLMHRHTGLVKLKLSKSPGRKRRLNLESVVYSGRVKMLSRQVPYGVAG